MASHAPVGQSRCAGLAPTLASMLAAATLAACSGGGSRAGARAGTGGPGPAGQLRRSGRLPGCGHGFAGERAGGRRQGAGAHHARR